MLGTNSNKSLILALAVFFAGACETGTEPEEEARFDAEAALEDHQAMDLLLQSETMAGFRALGQGLDFSGDSPALEIALKSVGALPTSSGTDQARSAAARILALAGEMGQGPLTSPIISDFRRGKTFVFDPELGRYVMDPELEGAPPTGVRFILYEPGPDGKPDSAAEVGHADLIDEGDESPEDIALRLVVVEGVQPRLSYAVTLDVLEEGGKITVGGHFQGDHDRLDFDIQVQGSDSGEQNTLDIDFEMGIAARGFQIVGSVSGVEGESGGAGEVDLRVRHGDHSFEVDVVGSETSLEGIFKLNGELFATVTGDPQEPTLTGASGEPLTWPEMLVLRQILDSTEDVFDFWEDLMDPVDELVILAIIL